MGNIIHSQFKNRSLPVQLAFRIAALFTIAFATTTVPAETIFESGTLGTTEIPFSDLLSQSVPGIIVGDSIYGGVRFRLDQPVVTTQIGGHFVDGSNGTFFGAIVALDDETDFPDSSDLSSLDVLGNAELTFPVPSDEVFGDLSLSLDPGWYALVFGSGLFSTSGNGGAPLNNPDIGNPSYIEFQPVAGGWFNRTIFPNRRYVVRGRIVPEASSMALACIASSSLLLRKRLRRSYMR